MTDAILSKEDFGATQSLVTRRTAEIMKEKLVEKKVARKLAAEEVARTFSETMTAEELEGLIGRSMAFHYGEKRNENRRKVAEEQRERRTAKKNETFTSMYRAWCQENDHVPSDAVLAHFSGGSPQSFSWARVRLAKEGFQFFKNGHGWNITPPAPAPSEKTYTEEELRAIVDRVLAEVKR
jgi:hypothetical protein